MKTGLTIAALVMLLAALPHIAWAQAVQKDLRQGNKLYGKEDFAGAEAKYGKALEADPTSEKAMFNQGAAYYHQDKYAEAQQNYEIAAELLSSPAERAAAYHNLGNALFQSKDLEKSVEAYKNALRLNPADEDTRYNLALAQRLLREQQQQQNQDQQQDENQQDQEQQEQENQQDQQDQQQQDDQQQQNGEQDQQDQQQQDQQQGDNEQQQQQEQGNENQGQAPQPSRLSPEEVRQLLESLQNDERKVQEKVIKDKTQAKPGKTDKDW